MMKPVNQHLRWMIPVVILLCCGPSVLGIPAASAQWLCGENLARVCDPDQQGHVFRPGVCSGYIMAAIDLDEELTARGVIPEPLFCMPDVVPISRVTAVVTDFIKTHPERKNDNAATLVINALGTAFPCKD